MRYEYIETIDKHYRQPWKPNNQWVEPLGYTKEAFFLDKMVHTDSKLATCLCCKTRRYWKDFPIKAKVQTFLSVEVRQTKDSPVLGYYGNICIYCMVKLHESLMKTYKVDQYEALYMLCAITNNYYDDNFAHQVFNDKDKVYRENVKPISEEVSWVMLYFREVYKVEGNERKDFWGSENFQFNAKKMIADADFFDAEKGFTKEDRDNLNTILQTYHYDPFEEDSPRYRPRLMSYLVTMIDDAMKDDLVRMQAALEIVRAFFRMEEFDKHIKALQDDDPIGNSNDIKKLIEMKKKEADMVSQFAKDNGFSEKYAISKSRGSGTMSAIVRDMDQSHYDYGAINKYDIETSAAIQQVSDISAESIFKQVGFQASDYADMVKQQAKTIRELQQELSSKKEELRLFKEKELKQEILEELRADLTEKGLPVDNVDEMINREINSKKRSKK